MANYTQQAACHKAVAGPQLRTFLLDLPSKIDVNDRTAAGVPTGVKVAHTIGSLPGVVNDVAIIYAPTRPLSLPC